jgi:methionyl aminopeptidase
MYTLGTSDIVIGDDGWTIRTKDGTIAALFEETVAVTSDGAEILTSA